LIVSTPGPLLPGLIEDAPLNAGLKPVGPTVPVPARVVCSPIVIALAGCAPFTCNVPPKRKVAAVYELFAVRIAVPVPAFEMPPEPLMTPVRTSVP